MLGAFCANNRFSGTQDVRNSSALPWGQVCDTPLLGAVTGQHCGACDRHHHAIRVENYSRATTVDCQKGLCPPAMRPSILPHRDKREQSYVIRAGSVLVRQSRRRSMLPLACFILHMPFLATRWARTSYRLVLLLLSGPSQTVS